MMTTLPIDPARRWALPAPLGERVDVFDRWPSRYIHASRRQPDDLRVADGLAALGDRGIAQWHRQQSQTLIDRHGLRALPLPLLLPSVARVVLLNGRELDALARLCSATLAAPAIRLQIGSEAAGAWRAALGQPLYTFALCHAHRHYGDSLKLPGVSAASDVHAATLLPLSPLSSRIEASGWRLLLSLAATMPAPVGRRFALKLPAGADLPAVESGSPEAGADALRLASSLTTCLDAPWLLSFNALP